MTRCQEQINVGAYLLGILEPDERDQMRDHLATCSACSADLGELSGLPALLAAVEVGDVGGSPAVTPSELGLRRLQAAAARESVRPPRRRGLAVAAAIAVALSLGGGLVALRAHQQSPQPLAVTAAAGGVHGRAVLTPTRSGTDVALTIGGVPSHESCRLVVVGRDGSRQPISTWTATYDGEAAVTASVSSRPGDIDRLVVETVAGRPLLVLTPPPA